MRNMEIVFNASDLAIEDRMFLKERLKVAAARKNNFKSELVRCSEKVTEQTSHGVSDGVINVSHWIANM